MATGNVSGTIAGRMGMDQAVGYAVLARCWQLLTGPITQLLIVFCFTEVTQGYYYAFSYLLGMQIFVELGLHVVVISISSHEWARLSLVQGRIEGRPESLARLASFTRQMQRWYTVVSVVFVTAVAICGWYYFQNAASVTPSASESAPDPVSWVAPWIVLVLLAGCQLPLLPLTAVLEGCHQLPVINRVRFWQAVVGSLVVWLLIGSGFGLWALPGSAAVRLGGEAFLVTVRYRQFFQSLRTAGGDTSLSWRNEVLPLQWRIAIQGILLWFVNGLPGLVIFRCHGEAEAGRLGMTWTILTALQSASLAWIETRRPQFGTLIADGRYQELDQLFFRLSRLSVSLMTTAVLAFGLLVWWMGTRQEWLFVRLSGRMLPADVTWLFGIALILLQLTLCTNLYVRAHKRDPYLAASILSSVTIAGLEFQLGRNYGVHGVAVGYLLGVACVQLPLWTLIWWYARKSWHGRAATDD